MSFVAVRVNLRYFTYSKSDAGSAGNVCCCHATGLGWRRELDDTCEKVSITPPTPGRLQPRPVRPFWGGVSKQKMGLSLVMSAALECVITGLFSRLDRCYYSVFVKAICINTERWGVYESQRTARRHREGIILTCLSASVKSYSFLSYCHRTSVTFSKEIK